MPPSRTIDPFEHHHFGDLWIATGLEVRKKVLDLFV